MGLIWMIAVGFLLGVTAGIAVRLLVEEVRAQERWLDDWRAKNGQKV